MLRDSNADVYATVNGRKGQLTNIVDYFSTAAESIKTDYDGLVNVIFIRNPGNKGFKTDWYFDIFSAIQSKKQLVGIEGHGNKYDVATATSVDLVITFKDDVSSFEKKCGSDGIDVFCQNSQLSNTEVNELFDAIESGLIERDMFAAIVMYVIECKMELTIIRANEVPLSELYSTELYSNPPVFVSDKYEGVL